MIPNCAASKAFLKGKQDNTYVHLTLFELNI